MKPFVSKRETFRRCLLTIWNQCSKFSSEEFRLFGWSRVQAAAPQSNQAWPSSSRRKSSALEWGQTQRWNSSTLDISSITWKRTLNLRITNASSCSRMLTCIRRTGGLSCLEWLSRAGGFAFRATQGTTPTLQVRQSRRGFSLPRLRERCSIELLRQRVTRLRMCSPYGIARRMSVLWTAHHSSRKPTSSHLLSVRSASGRWHHTLDSMARNWSYSLRCEMFLSWWTTMTNSRASKEKFASSTEWSLG